MDTNDVAAARDHHDTVDGPADGVQLMDTVDGTQDNAATSDNDTTVMRDLLPNVREDSQVATATGDLHIDTVSRTQAEADVTSVRLMDSQGDSLGADAAEPLMRTSRYKYDVTAVQMESLDDEQDGDAAIALLYEPHGEVEQAHAAVPPRRDGPDGNGPA